MTISSLVLILGDEKLTQLFSICNVSEKIIFSSKIIALHNRFFRFETIQFCPSFWHHG